MIPSLEGWQTKAKEAPSPFSVGKTQLVLFGQSNNTGVIDVKMDGFVLEENSGLNKLHAR